MGEGLNIIDLTTSEQIMEYFEDNEFIYIIYSEYGCKIGRSNNPMQRLEQIKQGLPSQKAIFIGLYKGENSQSFEKQLHNRLKNRNISGEWFILSQNILDDIDSFLLSNDYVRIMKISILWANYIIPSIYLRGHIRIIEIEKESKIINTRNKFPESLDRIIIKPSLEDLKSGNFEFLPTTEICKRIELLDYNYNPIELGKYLHSKGFNQKSVWIKNIGVRKVYEVCLKTNN